MAPIRPDEDIRTAYPLHGRKRFQTVNLLEGCRMVCPPSWTVHDLRYNYHRLYYVMGGEAWYDHEGRRLPLQPGTLYLFPSQYVRYRIDQNPSDPLRVLWCHFEMIPDITSDLISLPVEDDPYLRELVHLWNDIAGLSEPGNEIYHVVLLILHTLERMDRFEYLDPYFAQVQRYVLEHIGDDLSVAYLAKVFGYDRAYFSRKFRDVFRLSPGEYVRSVRMNHAANLLRNGVSPDLVCACVGYKDRKAFSRAFQQYFDSSPSRYLKNETLQP